MRTLIHVPNVHFGSVSQTALEALASELTRLQPDLTVFSGNIASSGIHRQVRKARAWMEQLPLPRLVVPGDRDVPRWDYLARLLFPFENFHIHFGSNPTPYYADNSMIAVGVNSARVLQFLKPTIHLNELFYVQELLATAAEDCLRVLVSNHPVFLPDHYAPNEADGRVFRSQVDLVLCSGLWPGAESKVFRASDTTVFVGGVKGEMSFNLIRGNGRSVEVETWVWEGKEFGKVEGEKELNRSSK